jgi:hypothetical protein
MADSTPPQPWHAPYSLPRLTAKGLQGVSRHFIGHAIVDLCTFPGYLRNQLAEVSRILHPAVITVPHGSRIIDLPRTFDCSPPYRTFRDAFLAFAPPDWDREKMKPDEAGECKPQPWGAMVFEEPEEGKAAIIALLHRSC